MPGGPRKKLIFNGAIIFFYSMPAGLPYALVIYQQQGMEAVSEAGRAWR